MGEDVPFHGVHDPVPIRGPGLKPVRDAFALAREPRGNPSSVVQIVAAAESRWHASSGAKA